MDEIGWRDELGRLLEFPFLLICFKDCLGMFEFGGGEPRVFGRRIPFPRYEILSAATISPVIDNLIDFPFFLSFYEVGHR